MSSSIWCNKRQILIFLCVLSTLSAWIPALISRSQLVYIRGGFEKIDTASNASMQARNVLAIAEQSLPSLTAMALDLSRDERQKFLTETNLQFSKLKSSLKTLLLLTTEFVSVEQRKTLTDSINSISESWHDLRDEPEAGAEDTELTFHFLKLIGEIKDIRIVLAAIDSKAENAAESATRASFDHIEQANQLLIWVILAAALMTMLAILGSFRVAQTTRQTNFKLRESEMRFKDIAESSSDWIWECDENLRFTYLSERFTQESGVPQIKILGKTYQEADIGGIADWNSHLTDLLARKSFRGFNHALRVENGDIRHWVTSGRPIFDADGNFKGYRGTGSDRTAEVRVQAELVRHRDHLQELVDNATRELKVQEFELRDSLTKEKKLNELQRQFVSMASHEFRTPLAIIDATAQRMKSRADKNKLTPEDALLRVEKIRAAVARMTRLMDSTLTAARMEEGKIEIEINPCDIREIIVEVCARQQEIAKSHVISSNLADLPSSMQADAGALEQVLTNLLSNAVKYAPNAPEIEVVAHTEGDHVTVRVRDYGVGIDEGDLDKIGERFFRARTSAGIAGTGIGLNLAKMLVDMHGGTFSVQSRKGEGSTFSIRLPIAGPGQTGQADIKVA